MFGSVTAIGVAHDREQKHTAHVLQACGFHQQPDVNYIQVLEKVDFPCTVNAQHLPFKGNQLRAQTG
jgi:hypothetical protein